MAEMKKCAHEGCSCMVAEGEKYCSTYCEDTKDVVALSCDCKHIGCEGDRH